MFQTKLAEKIKTRVLPSIIKAKDTHLEYVVVMFVHITIGIQTCLKIT
jgi:hypothetical protein